MFSRVVRAKCAINFSEFALLETLLLLTILQFITVSSLGNVRAELVINSVTHFIFYGLRQKCVGVLDSGVTDTIAA